MLALRRASIPLRNRGYAIVTSRACLPDLERSSKSAGDEARLLPSCGMTHNKILCIQKFYHTDYYSYKVSVGRRELSSQADAESKGEEDGSEDGFSELEIPAAGGLEETDANEADLFFEALLADDNLDVEESPENEMELSDAEIEASENKESGPSVALFKAIVVALFKAIVEAPFLSIHTALDKFVEERNGISRSEILKATYMLRKRRMYGRAWQLSEWVEEKKLIELVERDYASRVDLVAKLRGLEKAEKYIECIPESFKGELIYRTLLANCVLLNNMKKAEEVFNKMKDLKFPMTTFACNQLLLLYKRCNRKKIPDVLLLMENENVKPTPFTYKILIDVKGQSRDISGMESIVNSMEQEGTERDRHILAALAKYYAAAGLKEKTEALLKEMEGDDVEENHRAHQTLLPLYAELGNATEVERLWKACEPSPRYDECVAAIEAWGKLKKVEEAEAAFAKLSTISKISSKQYTVLLNVYAENKKLAKGKDLIKRMAGNGCQIGPFTWDALIRLYVNVGEVEKADFLLQKAAAQLSRPNKMKPSFGSYFVILEQYAKRGDVHNAEKVFFRMKQAGYDGRIRQYETLIKAYINAEVPAYGIKDRMKADNVFPNKFMSDLLLQVDPFKKTAVSGLLD